jgi:hypothetical protein
VGGLGGGGGRSASLARRGVKAVLSGLSGLGITRISLLVILGVWGAFAPVAFSGLQPFNRSGRVRSALCKGSPGEQWKHHWVCDDCWIRARAQATALSAKAIVCSSSSGVIGSESPG